MYGFEDLPYQTFLTPERQDAMFLMLSHVLFYVAPVLMTTVAIYLVGRFVIMIVSFVQKTDDDDDDDYEVYKY